MIVFEETDRFVAEGQYACAIGFFDGLHKGHKALIGKLKKSAAERGLKTLVVTFAQHPREIMKASYVPNLLTTTAERLHILEEEGIDACYVIKTKRIFELSSKVFMHQVLVNKLNVKYLLVGYDHHFGNDREHGFDYYKSCGELFGVEVEQEKVINVDGKKVSSSEIRRSLEAGKVEDAESMLGYKYFLAGTVVKGRSVGKSLGFPTANIALSDVRKQLPKEGVYGVKVSIEGDKHIYKGVLNIGIRPTFIELKPIKTIEVHIVDFSDDIYGKEIRLDFVKYLRAEEKFDNPEQLSRQIREDLQK